MPVTVAITAGDPAGIGPEIIAKGLGRNLDAETARVIVIGPWAAIAREAAVHAPDVKLSRPESVEDLPPGEVGVLDVAAGSEEPAVAGKPTDWTNRVAGRAVERAADLALEGRVDAVVTAPLTKRAFAQIGSPHHGHTEYFAWRAGTDRFAMMFTLGEQRVVLVTTHLPLARVPEALTRERIVSCAVLLEGALERDFGVRRPRLGVAGLNPHAGEDGLLGDEEDRIIRPAVELCRAEGLDASGPYAADTLFWHMRSGRFDGVVAMYHDQALIPIKILGPERAVNVTLGLPFVRTSVSHGTGFDIAGRGEADETSLVEALNLAARMAAARIKADR